MNKIHNTGNLLNVISRMGHRNDRTCCNSRIVDFMLFFSMKEWNNGKRKRNVYINKIILISLSQLSHTKCLYIFVFFFPIIFLCWLQWWLKKKHQRFFLDFIYNLEALRKSKDWKTFYDIVLIMLMTMIWMIVYDCDDIFYSFWKKGKIYIFMCVVYLLYVL